MDLSFPIKEHLSEEAYTSLIAAAKLLYKSRYAEGVAALTALRDSLGEAEFIGRSFVWHRVNSANFERGEYLLAYKGAQELMEVISKVYNELQNPQEGAESPLSIKEVEYFLLKEQVFTAKCLNKMKDFTKAEDVCDDILELINKKGDDEEVTKAHKFALKAHYMRAKNQLNLMEFRNAHTILEDQAKPLLKRLIAKYHIKGEEEKQE